MKIIAANFKMNKNQKETKEYLSAISNPTKAKVMVAVPFTSLCATAGHLKGIEIGAQNVHYEKSGAYTGEVSADMLKEAGASFVIVGHSERRKYFGETDISASKRAVAATNAGLDVIYCVGEDFEQREKGVTSNVISWQLCAGLGGVSKLNKIIVAYEPVWAIGTGKSASLAEIAETHKHIKKYLLKKFGKNIPVLYGGSVNEKNIKDICSLENVDGVLIGGASLDAKRMQEMINNAN